MKNLNINNRRFYVDCKIATAIIRVVTERLMKNIKMKEREVM